MRRLLTRLLSTFTRTGGTLLALLALAAPTAAQSLAGRWKGGLPQDDKTFIFTMQLDVQQAGNQLSGTCRLTNDQGQWAVQQFVGTVAGTTVVLTETRLLACTPGTGRSFWCAKKLLGTLKIVKKNSFISGTWTAANCAPGHFLIAKATTPVAARPRRAVPPVSAPPALNQQVTFQNVLFEQSKAVLLSTSEAELNQLAAMLLARPQLRVSIDGHADKIGEAQKNLTLSQQRAQAVKQYLVAHGIAEARISTHGYGDTRLLCPPPCAANQRVEFTLTK